MSDFCSIRDSLQSICDYVDDTALLELGGQPDFVESVGRQGG